MEESFLLGGQFVVTELNPITFFTNFVQFCMLIEQSMSNKKLKLIF